MSETTDSRPRWSFFTLVVVVTCVGLAAVNVGLVLNKRSLEGEVTRLMEAVHASGQPPLVEGERLPALSTWDASGQAVDVARSSEHTVTLLLVSSDSCGVCETARPVWRELAERAQGSHVRVLELVVDAPADSLAGREAPYPVLRAGADVWALTSRMPGIPAALLVDDTGDVRRAFYGEVQDGLREAVEAALLGESL